MQIKPVTKTNKPEYPTANEIDIPKVLNASKPNKWKRNAAIGIVMVGMMFTMNSSEVERIQYDYGFTGCVMVIPPVFISESEAKNAILLELEIGGIEIDTVFNSIDSKLIGFQNNTFKFQRFWFYNYYLANYMGFSEKENLSINLIYTDEMFSSSNNPNYIVDLGYHCSSEPVTFAFFYIPEKPWDDDYDLALLESKDKLRVQVRDFLAWYKENKGKK